MPNRYEREIEEILRNLDNSESKTTKGPRFGQRSRRRPVDRNRRPRAFPSFHLRPVDWFLVIAVVTALVAGGYAYAQSDHNGNLVTGILAIISALCLLLVLITPLLSRSPRSSRYVGEMKVTPLSRNPLSNLATRWHLFTLKMRYRRRRDH